VASVGQLLPSHPRLVSGRASSPRRVRWWSFWHVNSIAVFRELELVGSCRSFVIKTLTELSPPCRVRWCSFWHVNGVAVFREETDANGGGGAMMVSSIVRASPKSVYKVLPGAAYRDAAARNSQLQCCSPSFRTRGIALTAPLTASLRAQCCDNHDSTEFDSERCRRSRYPVSRGHLSSV